MAASSTMNVIEESSVGTIVGTIITSAESELKFQLDSGDIEYFWNTFHALDYYT